VEGSHQTQRSYLTARGIGIPLLSMAALLSSAARSDIAATFRSRLDQIAAAEPVLSRESVWYPTLMRIAERIARGQGEQGCAYCPFPAESQLSTLTR